MNKFLEAIIAKTMEIHHKDWENLLIEALEAYKTTWRSTMGYRPYELVYRK